MILSAHVILGAQAILDVYANLNIATCSNLGANSLPQRQTALRKASVRSAKTVLFSVYNQGRIQDFAKGGALIDNYQY